VFGDSEHSERTFGDVEGVRLAAFAAMRRCSEVAQNGPVDEDHQKFAMNRLFFAVFLLNGRRRGAIQFRNLTTCDRASRRFSVCDDFVLIGTRKIDFPPPGLLRPLFELPPLKSTSPHL
jgi:hypothetical protein